MALVGGRQAHQDCGIRCIGTPPVAAPGIHASPASSNQRGKINENRSNWVPTCLRIQYYSIQTVNYVDYQNVISTYTVVKTCFFWQSMKKI